MVAGLINLFILVMAVFAVIIWISGVIRSDGKCHFENCDECPFPCDQNGKRQRSDKAGKEE